MSLVATFLRARWRMQQRQPGSEWQLFPRASACMTSASRLQPSHERAAAMPASASQHRLMPRTSDALIKHAQSSCWPHRASRRMRVLNLRCSSFRQRHVQTWAGCKTCMQGRDSLTTYNQHVQGWTLANLSTPLPARRALSSASGLPLASSIRPRLRYAPRCRAAVPARAPAHSPNFLSASSKRTSFARSASIAVMLSCRSASCCRGERCSSAVPARYSKEVGAAAGRNKHEARLRGGAAGTLTESRRGALRAVPARRPGRQAPTLTPSGQVCPHCAPLGFTPGPTDFRHTCGHGGDVLHPPRSAGSQLAGRLGGALQTPSRRLAGCCWLRGRALCSRLRTAACKRGCAGCIIFCNLCPFDQRAQACQGFAPWLPCTSSTA